MDTKLKSAAAKAASSVPASVLSSVPTVPNIQEIQVNLMTLSGTGVDPVEFAPGKQILFVPSVVSSLHDLSETKSRESWAGRLDFLLSCIGFAVGLGNIWRFPYLCYKSGGGAFLIPYTFFMIMCGLPLFYLEVAYGQFASLSPITVWRMCPMFRGIGYGMVIISAIVCIYYNVIIAWDLYFLYHSFSKVLPWALCDQPWNTPQCVLHGVSVKNITNDVWQNSTLDTMTSSASSEFWERGVLEMTDGIENFGTIRWPLFICLVVAWVIVFLCLIKGIRSSGRVVYVTALFPYIVLTALLVRGVTLPGAGDGIKFYLIPKWDKLLHINVWGDAAVQIFYSVGMAWGSLITMASYNKFNHNFFREAMMVPIINCGTSVYAGFAIFSVLGFMANKARLPVEKVVSQGPGLTFVAYPEAVSQMPFAQMWAVLFFLMIFTVGIDSQFGMFETITSAFIDEYPKILRKRKLLFTAFVCLVECLLGTPLVFQGGIYLLTIIDWYSATFSLMLICVLECVVISWIYGINRFFKDINLMLGHPPFKIWKYMWKYITPSLVLFTWCFSVGTLEPVSIKSYKFPPWAVIMGWCMGLCSLVPIPIQAILGIKREKTGTCWQRIKKLCQPAYNWGPAQEVDKVQYVLSMDQREREKFEAAHFMVDRDRYMTMKEFKNAGQLVSMNLEGVEDISTLQRLMFLPEANNVLASSKSARFSVSFNLEIDSHPEKHEDI